ncbi:MAG TPA: hypothetical protein VGD04_07380 [Methylophilus sp.]
MYSANHQFKTKQAGAMLIMLAIFVVLASLTLLVTQLNGRTQKNQHDQQTAAALAEAKAALIGYAMTYDDTHPGEVYGYLPCPDTDATTDPSGEGAQSICGNLNVSVLGRLPWKTLKLAPLRDGSGECLWYAVSGNFKNNPKINNLSPNFNGLFNVLAANGAHLAGPAVDTRAVAVIFAPGAILPGQDRSTDPNAVRCGGNYGAANYLDIDIFNSQNNAVVPSDNSAFVAAENSQLTANNDDYFNDQLLLIRPSEIFAAYCKKYVNTLLNQISPNVNGCNASAAEVTPKIPKLECSKATAYLESTCTNTCYEAAETLMTSNCLGNMAATGCQAAVNTLRGCNV